MSSSDKNVSASRQRFVWVAKPIFLVAIFVWCLHPGNSNPDNLEHKVLWSFLLGAVYGLFLNRETFNLLLKPKSEIFMRRKNRLPREYYFGKIKEVLFRP